MGILTRLRISDSLKISDFSNSSGALQHPQAPPAIRLCQTRTATVRAPHDDAGHEKTSSDTVRLEAGSERRGRVLNDEAAAQPVVHTVAEQPNGTAGSTRRQSELPTPPMPSRNRSVPFRSATLLLLLRLG